MGHGQGRDPRIAPTVERQRRLGKIISEYFGPGLASLTVDQRTTICNMGAELGATTSIFPSDDQTRRYLAAQRRPEDWIPLSADPDATYAQVVEIDLALEPLVAKPSDARQCRAHHRGRWTAGVVQVCVGSCVNSSFEDLMTVAAILKGKQVHPSVSMTITPGSKQVFTMVAENGALADMIVAGVRVLEAACGPCLGIGQAPQPAWHPCAR